MESHDLLEAFQASIASARARGHWLWVEAHRLRNIGISDDQAALIVAELFDKTCRSDETNTIVLDGAGESDINFRLVDGFLVGLSPLIAGLPGRSLVKESTGFAINQILAVPGLAEVSELACQFTSDLLGEGIQKISSSTIEALLQPVTDKLGAQAIEAAESKFTDILGDMAQEGFGLIAYLQGRRLSLSPEAESNLRAEFEILRKDPPKTPSGSFQMILRMLLACSLGRRGRKVIILKNPEHLDPATFNALRQLLLLARQSAQEGNCLPISCVVLNSSLSKKGAGGEWLQRLRLFTIRNALYQAPLTRLPRPAISDFVFVGRDPELSRLRQDDDNVAWRKGRCVISVISAESGIGKTKLALAYFDRLRQCEGSAPPFLLSLACPPEIGTGEGSVQSLLNSLEGNLEALLAGRSLLTRAADYAQDQLTAKQLVKRIIGMDLVEVGRSLVDLTQRQDLRKNLAGRLEAAAGLEETQEAFDRLLKEALRLYRKQHDIDDETPVPIYLLIDDLHWITEGTAGVILKHLIASHPTRILVTMRPAEWKSKLQMSVADPARHGDFLLLAALFGLTPAENLPGDLASDATELLRKISLSTSHIPLSGFSPDMLGQAISMVMKPKASSEAVSQGAAEAIVEFLGDEQAANSLMAIETFNLLAEEGFADRHGTWPLVTWQDDRPKWTAACYAVSIRHEVLLRLARLKNLYNETYRDASPLSLASYAIFEEKLTLLTSYLSDAGPAGRYFLYLAAVAGSPFLRHPVEMILQSLASTENETISPRALQRLRLALQWNESLDFEDCCHVFETVFTILRQAKTLKNGYEFHHDLLLTFFEARFDEALEDLCKGLPLEETRDFCRWFHEVCYKHFDVAASYDDLQLQDNRTEALAIVEAQVRIGRRLLSNYPSAKTAIDAYNALSIAVKLQSSIGDPSAALHHQVEMLEICETHLTFEPPHGTLSARIRVELGKCFKDLLRFDLARRALLPVVNSCPESLDNLSYIVLSAQMLADITCDPEESVRYLERAADLHGQQKGEISRQWAAIDPGSGIEQRISIDNSKALAHRNANNMHGYLELTKGNLDRIKELVAEDSSKWLRSYTLHLNNYAEALRLNDEWTASDMILGYALLILRSKFAEEGDIWAADLVRAYHNQANSYLERGLQEQALASFLAATSQVEPLLQPDQPFDATLAEAVAFVWGATGSVARELGDHGLELSVKSNELELLRTLHAKRPQKMTLIYAQEMISFAARLIALAEADGAARIKEEPEHFAEAMLEQALMLLQEAHGLVGAQTHSDEAYARAHYSALSYMALLKTDKTGLASALELLMEMANLSLARVSQDRDFWHLAADGAIEDIVKIYENAGHLQEATAWRDRCKNPT